MAKIVNFHGNMSGAAEHSVLNVAGGFDRSRDYQDQIIPMMRNAGASLLAGEVLNPGGDPVGSIAIMHLASLSSGRDLVVTKLNVTGPGAVAYVGTWEIGKYRTETVRPMRTSLPGASEYEPGVRYVLNAGRPLAPGQLEQIAGLMGVEPTQVQVIDVSIPGNADPLAPEAGVLERMLQAVPAEAWMRNGARMAMIPPAYGPRAWAYAQVVDGLSEQTPDILRMAQVEGGFAFVELVQPQELRQQAILLGEELRTSDTAAKLAEAVTAMAINLAYTIDVAADVNTRFNPGANGNTLTIPLGDGREATIVISSIEIK